MSFDLEVKCQSIFKISRQILGDTRIYKVIKAKGLDRYITPRNVHIYQTGGFPGREISSIRSHSKATTVLF